MLHKIFNKDSLFQQANALKKKKFKPGFDGMSADGAAAWIFINGDRLCKDIFSGNYQPMPALGFKTAKAHGNFRELAKLSALDVIIQTTLNDYLSPVADEFFSDSSFAYRTGRGVHSALERYVSMANKYRFIAKVDFISCFQNIDHTLLHKILDDSFNDPALCRLIMSFVSMPVSVDGEIKVNDKGLLQGMPLAPLLCNLYLHNADTFLDNRGIMFIRYSDDIVLFADSQAEIEKHLSAFLHFCEKELLLTPNHRKTLISSPTGISYLGYKFVSDKKGVIAYEANSTPKTVYHAWYDHYPNRNRHRTELLSDGILRQKDFTLLFDTETQDVSIPVEDTSVINIYSNVIFDTGFLELTMRHGIRVNVFDKKGEHIGAFIPSTPLKSPKTTHEQLMEYYGNESQRLLIAKEFLSASIHHSVLNIRYYNKHTPSKELESALRKLHRSMQVIKDTSDYNTLLLEEARARQTYYGCFDTFISGKGFVFDMRTRRPPKNEVNAMISFGNTVLYNLIATEIQKTPLDVRIGFLHSTNSRMESLNLDIAEIFKPLIVDRTVFKLINKCMLKQHDFFETDTGAVYLKNEAKRVFLQEFYEKLDSKLTVGDNTMSYNTIIIEEIRKLVRHFRTREKYKAYWQVR